LIAEELSVTVTEATGAATAVTVATDEPCTPPLVAMMLAVPLATAVTTPLEETDATAGLELLHEIVTPLITFPFASLATATAWVVCPTEMLDEFKVTLIDVNVGVATVADADPCTLPLVATTLAVPVANAVTRPLDETETTAGLELLHVTETPLIG
jgi:hypothetical protein